MPRAPIRGPPARAPSSIRRGQELVDLHLVGQRRALGRDHGPTQLVQDQPRGLVAREPRAGAGAASPRSRDGAWRPGTRPRTRSQRRTRAVHDRPGRHRRLVAAARADPQVPARLTTCASATAAATHARIACARETDMPTSPASLASVHRSRRSPSSVSDGRVHASAISRARTARSWVSARPDLGRSSSPSSPSRSHRAR